MSVTEKHRLRSPHHESFLNLGIQLVTREGVGIWTTKNGMYFKVFFYIVTLSTTETLNLDWRVPKKERNAVWTTGTWSGEPRYRLNNWTDKIVCIENNIGFSSKKNLSVLRWISYRFYSYECFVIFTVNYIMTFIYL